MAYAASCSSGLPAFVVGAVVGDGEFVFLERHELMVGENERVGNEMFP
jgi:hypothetical protein